MLLRMQISNDYIFGLYHIRLYLKIAVLITDLSFVKSH